MNTDGKNSLQIKSSNRGLVMELVATGREDSRIGISQTTGLSKMTVTNIVNELITANVIQTGEKLPMGTVGPKPQALCVSQNSPLILGIYIARDKIYGLLCDISMQALKHDSMPLADETSDSLADKLFALCRSLLTASERAVWAIGVATIGPVDVKTGIILKPNSFFGIENFELAKLLENEFDLPVYVENDMNAAALAEMYFGAGRSAESFLYIGLTNGVGAGIISNHRLYEPGYGLAGELGHTGVNLEGPPCPCGRRGCTELYVSIPVITQTLHEATGLGLSFEEYCTLSTAEVVGVFDKVADILSYAVLNQVNMLNPQLVLLGHEGAYLPHRCVKRLSQKVNKYKLWGEHSSVSFGISFFGNMAPVFGSICVVLSQWFSGNLPERYL